MKLSGPALDSILSLVTGLLHLIASHAQAGGQLPEHSKQLLGESMDAVEAAVTKPADQGA